MRSWCCRRRPRRAARLATASRFLNGGQSCIAAKRIILVKSIAEDFLICFQQKIAQLKQGDPTHEETDIGRWHAPTCAMPCTGR